MIKRQRIQKNSSASRRKTCEEKRFFETEAAALEAADIRMLDNMAVTIGVYHCPICRNWHLTSIKT